MSRRQAPDPLHLMRRADPVDLERLRAELDESAVAAAMARAIGMAEARPEPEPAGASFAGARPLVLVAGLVVLIAAVLLVTGAFSGGGSHPTYAAAAIEVAEANPRLLVTAPGWKVIDAGEHFETEDGEMRFGDGSRTLTLNWYPGRYYRSYLRDRAQVSPPRRSRLLGRTATTVEYARGEYATMLAPIGRVFVEVRGQLGDRADYEAVLHSLRRVDVDTWLAAMPASVVSPDTRAATVERMLGGLPYPPDFDPGALEGETAVLDHYELGVRVASAIACGWVESWLAARRSGDAQAERNAVDALAGARRWPLLVQMEREVPGGWAHNVWTVASKLRTGHLDQGFAGALVRPDGSGYRLGPTWAVGLECRSSIRKVPFDGR